MNNKNVLVPLLWTLWGGIGGYRGHQEYNKKVKEEIDRHNRYYKTAIDRPKHYFITNVAFIAWFSVCYITPPFSIAGIYNEIYELEDFIRTRK